MSPVPLLEATVPQWSLPILRWDEPALVASNVRLSSASPPAASDVVPELAMTAPSSIDWVRLVAAAWLLGALVSLAGLVTGLVRLARITTRCTLVGRGRWRDLADELSSAYALQPVTVLQSAEPSLLVTCGLLKPKIVLPARLRVLDDTRRSPLAVHANVAQRRTRRSKHHDNGVLQLVDQIGLGAHKGSPYEPAHLNAAPNKPIGGRRSMGRPPRGRDTHHSVRSRPRASRTRTLPRCVNHIEMSWGTSRASPILVSNTSQPSAFDVRQIRSYRISQTLYGGMNTAPGCIV